MVTSSENQDIQLEFNNLIYSITHDLRSPARTTSMFAKLLEKDYKEILPDEAKLYADSVVIGEVENIWPKLLDDLKCNKLSPFYASQQKVDLEESPVPRYELLEEKPYRIASVQATRGCPHN